MLLRTYNLSPGQQLRLHQDLSKQQKIPVWAEHHKQLSHDKTNPIRFDQLYSEFAPQVLHVRNKTAQTGLYGLEESLTEEFLFSFLKKMGYARNKNNCLYRTDIPSLFRGDERTPFELANDGWMLPRYNHRPGATTQKPMSATVRLREATSLYGKDGPDPEYLLYNSQTNKYPGKKPDDTDGGSDNSDSSDSSDSSNHSSASDNDWSDSDTSLQLDSERNYETTRHNQNIRFVYAIDTRNMEVVLGEENHAFNKRADVLPTWFPEDDLEALISVSRRGINADRIWLFDSNFKRAVRVRDLTEQADNDYQEEVQARTHAGSYNKEEYDGLIDKAAKAGKPILELNSDKDWFANDIVWPPIPVVQNPS